MGRGRNKNKDKDPFSGPTKPRGRRDSDSDFSEATTHLTFDDDLTSIQGDSENIDDIYDKLSENLDNAQDKNIPIRTAALSGLIFLLSSNYAPEFIERNKMTIVSLANKLDNKTAEESVLLVTLVTLVSIQSGDEISDYLEEPMAQMRTILMDSSRNNALRCSCALSLGIVSRISSEHTEQIMSNIKACRFVWQNMKPSTNNTKLFSLCLQSWCLLLLDGDGSAITSAIDGQKQIVQYLTAEQLDVRIAAGEALSFLYEFVADSRPDFEFTNHAHVLEVLGALADESTKRKTKKDKRIQRYTFREIYSYISGEDDTPEVVIKFGRESLLLNSCSIKLFYDLCCEVLRGGMMRHLLQNEVLRCVFDLPPPTVSTSLSAADKAERMAVHVAAEKYRKQSRGKQRDKRNAIY